MNAILWTPKAAKQLRKIDRQHQVAIRDAVSHLSLMPECQNIKALRNHQYDYRLRVGNFRVLFDWGLKLRLLKSKK